MAKDPFGPIVEKLDAIISMLTSDPPDPPAPGDVTISTGAAFVPYTDAVFCNLTNLGTADLNVVNRAVNQDGTTRHSGTSDVPPGHTRGFGSQKPDGPQLVRCEFSFFGFASDVRGTMEVLDGGIVGPPRVSLDAR